MQQEISPAAWSSFSLAGIKHVSHALDLSISSSLCSTTTTNQHLGHSEHHRYQDLSTPTETSRYLLDFLLSSLSKPPLFILWHSRCIPAVTRDEIQTCQIHVGNPRTFSQPNQTTTTTHPRQEVSLPEIVSQPLLLILHACARHSPSYPTSKYKTIVLIPATATTLPESHSCLAHFNTHTKRSSSLFHCKGIRELLNHGTALLYQRYRAGRREKVPKLCLLRFRRGSHGLRSRPHLLTSAARIAGRGWLSTKT